MIIAVKANAAQQQEWISKPVAQNVQLVWAGNDVPDADAYFDLTYEDFGAAFNQVNHKPVFVNSVINTGNELAGNVNRLNAWNGFLKRDILEVVLKDEAAANVLQQLGWKYQQVPDVPGMIAARTISMIVNEAYFALGDEVSTREEIDIAMKLGTNYPYGPFEWSRIIGLHNIYRLLKKLGDTDTRYQPAPALEQELKSIA